MKYFLSLREFVVFKIIPMMNPDGVFLGNQRFVYIVHSYISTYIQTIHSTNFYTQLVSKIHLQLPVSYLPWPPSLVDVTRKIS